MPAWKRLGLKLKYAQETETAIATSRISQKTAANGIAAAEPSISQINGHSITSPRSKKRRLEGQHSGRTNDNTNGLKRSSSLKAPGSNVRKSVTFTPETKEDDGESSNFMQDKWDEEARNDQINDFLAREAEDAEAAANSQISLGKNFSDSSERTAGERKPKREKKERQILPERPTADLGVHQPKSTRKSKDALEYLQQYQSSRSTWKFNKNREVWLLKHILSKADIPSSHESALFDYISGMKSENAKRRLMDQCHDCIVDQVEGESDDSDRALMSKSLKMDTTQRRIAYYRAANQRFENAFQSALSGEAPQEDRDVALNRHERVDRATKLLESILDSASREGVESGTMCGLQDAGTFPPKQPSPDCVVAVPKKRKNRTVIVDVSSSEDTSSDSGSDSDS